MANKIDTTNITDSSQLPLTAPRLDFLQNNADSIVASLINGLVNYTTGQVIILWGCAITYTPMGATASIAAGAIYYNGHVYQVPAASLTGLTSSQIPLFITEVVFSDQSTPATFSDGAQWPVLKEFLITIVAGSAGGSGVTNYIGDYNGANVITYGMPVYKPFTLSSGYTSGDNAGYTKDRDGWVTLNGSLIIGSITSSTFATLPVGFRPVSEWFIPVLRFQTSSSTYIPALLVVAPNGLCGVFTPALANLSNGDVCYLVGPVRFNVNF